MLVTGSDGLLVNVNRQNPWYLTPTWVAYVRISVFQPSMKLLMTAKKDKGRYIIAMNPEFLRRGEPSTLGKVKAVAQRRQYIVYDNGFKANKTL